ncbi:MAG: trypsin-like peptidase domain-containing protein [Opitutaceae bacterium]|jgi:hypothetical protein|nr:trypsin-like peptidase domain-containing protein [Opitutaceae bacterium]
MLVGGAVAIILVAAGIGWYLIYGGGDPAEKLAEVADEKQAAMGVLTFRDSSSEDDKLQGNGTAWAIAPRVFVTNAALVWSASEMMNMSVDIFIVVKGENGAEQLRVTGSRQHPRDLSSIMSGRDSLPIAAPFDIGLLLVERDAPAWFEIAGESDLLAMEADMPIGFMAHTRTVSLTDPRPRSGSGKIVALTNYWGEASDASERYVIEYDLPVIPEMSGGPIFNVDGEVVGLLTIPMISNPDPSPNESPKYYGQRIDLLKEVWSDYPRD